jgi:hypothetical protein
MQGEIPKNKKRFLKQIATFLVHHYGKRRFYLPKEVLKAVGLLYKLEKEEYSSWAMSAFCTVKEFNAYHQKKGIVCDYYSMKSQILEGFSTFDEEKFSSDWNDTMTNILASIK